MASAELMRLAEALGYPAEVVGRTVPRMTWGGSLKEIAAALGLNKAAALAFVEALPEYREWRARCEARQAVEAERAAERAAAELAIRERAAALAVGEWLILQDVPHLITAAVNGAVPKLRLQPYTLDKRYSMGRAQVWGRLELARLLAEVG